MKSLLRKSIIFVFIISLLLFIAVPVRAQIQDWDTGDPTRHVFSMVFPP